MARGLLARSSWLCARGRLFCTQPAVSSSSTGSGVFRLYRTSALQLQTLQLEPVFRPMPLSAPVSQQFSAGPPFSRLPSAPREAGADRAKALGRWEVAVQCSLGSKGNCGNQKPACPPARLLPNGQPKIRAGPGALHGEKSKVRKVKVMVKVGGQHKISSHPQPISASLLPICLFASPTLLSTTSSLTLTYQSTAIALLFVQSSPVILQHIQSREYPTIEAASTIQHVKPSPRLAHGLFTRAKSSGTDWW